MHWTFEVSYSTSAHCRMALPVFSALKPEGAEVSATLTRIVGGNPTISDTLTNEQTVKCPRCEQTYRLGYSDSEWHRVKDWLKLAATAIRNDHDLRHEAVTIPLEWRGIRRGEGICCFCERAAATAHASAFASPRGYPFHAHRASLTPTRGF